MEIYGAELQLQRECHLPRYLAQTLYPLIVFEPLQVNCQKSRESFQKGELFGLLEGFALVAEEAIGAFHGLWSGVVPDAVTQRHVGLRQVQTQVDFGFIPLAD